jgi:hypothetical protein
VRSCGDGGHGGFAEEHAVDGQGEGRAEGGEDQGGEESHN